MTLRDAQACVMAELAPSLRERAFSPGMPGVFLRTAGPKVLHVLSFGVKSRESGGFSFGCGVGIRFEAIEEITGREDDEPFKSTVGVPIHLLREDQTYGEWFFSNVVGLKSLVPDVLTDVRTYAFPFFEKYSSIEAIWAQLAQESPRQWLGRNPEARIKLLAAITYVESGREAALALLSKHLEDPQAGRKLNIGDLMTFRKRLLEHRVVAE